MLPSRRQVVLASKLLEKTKNQSHVSHVIVVSCYINTREIIPYNALPFQSLDDLEYKLNVTKQRNFSQDDMDGLNQLKLNPFQSSHDLEIFGNCFYSDPFFDMNITRCDYYLPKEFKE